MGDKESHQMKMKLEGNEIAVAGKIPSTQIDHILHTHKIVRVNFSHLGKMISRFSVLQLASI